MQRKLFTLFIITFFSALVLAACSGDNNNEDNNNNNNNDPNDVLEENNENENNEEENNDNNNNENEENNNNEENEENEEDEKPEGSGQETSGDFNDLLDFMAETTDGEVDVLYENMNQETHESDTISVTLNGYTLVELNDFHTNFSIPFDDETDGGVLVADYTIENTSDEDSYFMTSFDIEYTGASKYHNNYDKLLPEDVQIPKLLNPNTDYLIEAGETIQGYYAYAFGPDNLEKILDLGEVTIRINRPFSDKGDVTSYFGKEGQFVIPVSETGEERVESNKSFYQDKVTYDDMGEKIMIKEKSDIGESQDLRDVSVTLDGYQFTEFIPNEEEAPRFSNADEGIVLLTVKFLVDNNGDEEVDQGSGSSKVIVNDGTTGILNTGMLLNYKTGSIIEAGDSDEWLQIYMLDQEQYEKIWKDKSFEVEIGPFRNQDGEDISKGSTISFELPE